jgi:hypothetical protein
MALIAAFMVEEDFQRISREARERRLRSDVERKTEERKGKQVQFRG